MAKSVEQVRGDIPFLKTGVIYLDNAATTPTPEPIIAAMLEYFREYGVNVGRGLYRATRKATEVFEGARENVAKVINAAPDEIAYTKNTTEGINIVAQGLGLKRGDKVVTTILEHHSNLLPWQRLQDRGVELEVIGATSECLLRPEDLEAAIDKNTRLIATHHISNSIGSVQPVREIGKIAREHEILFLLDAAQSVGHMPVDVKKIGCDFLSAPGHKGLLGPQGTGFLYFRKDIGKKLKPLLVGGGIVLDAETHRAELTEPPEIFDAGTPNIPGVIGLGRACDYVLEIGVEKIEAQEKKLTEIMMKIKEFPNVAVYGPPSIESRGGVVSFNIKGLGFHDVAAMLDELEKIAIRSGNHCAQPTMKHLGIGGTARASVHYYNLEEEVSKFVEAVGKVSKELGG
ncbi:MAG: cysteine desulfurase [Candidatus Hadarchaeota archaeon]